METPNERRARQGTQALTAFCLATRRRALGALGPEGGHEALSDLLCDLRHLADRREGLDYAMADRRAGRHYRDEVLKAQELAA